VEEECEDNFLNLVRFKSFTCPIDKRLRTQGFSFQLLKSERRRWWDITCYVPNPTIIWELTYAVLPYFSLFLDGNGGRVDSFSFCEIMSKIHIIKYYYVLNSDLYTLSSLSMMHTLHSNLALFHVRRCSNP